MQNIFTRHVLTKSDFPTLFDVPHPPKELYVMGSVDSLKLLERLPDQGLAIVGTRDPETRSQTLVSKTLSELSNSPLIIISGFARGIDTTAHWSALKENLPTIAILGCGLNISYPPENEDLKIELLSRGGLLITELKADERPQPYTFLKRNRLIASFARATWVVQAPTPSGALNTAEWAKKLDRDIYVTPHFPNYAPFAGNQRLLEEGTVYPLFGARQFSTTWLSLHSLWVAQLNHKNSSKSALHNHDYNDHSDQSHSLSITVSEKFNAPRQENCDRRIRFENGQLYRT